MKKLFAKIAACIAVVATSLLFVFTDFVLAGLALHEQLPGRSFLIALCVVHGIGVQLIVFLWIMRGYVAERKETTIIAIKGKS